MTAKVTHISLIVRDQEEALQWYIDKLEFAKQADSPFPGGSHRWLTISPRQQPELEIVLEPPEWETASSANKAELIGKQPGWVIATNDCKKDYELLKTRGVEFISPPEEMPWGISAVFKDLYGNQHNLLETPEFFDSPE